MYVTILNRAIPANRRTTIATIARETEKAILLRVTETRTAGRLAGDESSEEVWLPKSQLLAWGDSALVTDANWLANEKLRSAAVVTRRFGLKGQFHSPEQHQQAAAEKALTFATGTAELAVAEYDSFGDIFPWATEA